MIWSKSKGVHTANSEGLNFVLEPTDWSIWDLDQAKASALHIANLKAYGLSPWAPGCQAKLFYRAQAKK